MTGPASIASQYSNESVRISGFEQADDCVHMIEWLRRGRDFRTFVVQDVERELYLQDAKSQLLSVACGKPELETKLRKAPEGSTAIVVKFSIVFPIVVEVRGGDGRLWRLHVRNGYLATGDPSESFQLRADFNIVRPELIEG